MKSIFDKRGRIGLAPQAVRICFILCKQQFRCALAVKSVKPKLWVGSQDVSVCRRMKCRFGLDLPPRPGVAEPQSRKQMQNCRLGPSVENRNSNQDVFRLVFCIFDEYIEIAVIVEYSGIEQ